MSFVILCDCQWTNLARQVWEHGQMQRMQYIKTNVKKQKCTSDCIQKHSEVEAVYHCFVYVTTNCQYYQFEIAERELPNYPLTLFMTHMTIDNPSHLVMEVAWGSLRMARKTMSREEWSLQCLRLHSQWVSNWLWIPAILDAHLLPDVRRTVMLYLFSPASNAWEQMYQQAEWIWDNVGIKAESAITE